MTAEKIKKAYANAAKLVEIYGEKYLVIFERLHEEMLGLEKTQNVKAIALSIATKTKGNS